MKIQFDNYATRTPRSAAPARWILTSIGVAYENGTWVGEEAHLLVDLGSDTAQSIKDRALDASRKQHAQNSRKGLPNPAVGFFFIGYDEGTLNREVKEWEES